MVGLGEVGEVALGVVEVSVLVGVTVAVEGERVVGIAS